MTVRRLAAALAAVLVAGCDFTPALDIDVPQHEARAVISAVLAADSVAVVRVGVSRDPYGTRGGYGERSETPTARVTLVREGGAAEVLVLRPCSYEGGFEEPACGAYVGVTPVEAGATYTVRAEVEGVPTAEGTVTVPPRPAATVEETTVGGGTRTFRVRLEDAAGPSRYGIALLSRRIGSRYRMCEGSVCRDSSSFFVTDSWNRFSFETSNPALIAAAREAPGDGIEFAAFTDETFDGRAFTFTMEADPQRRYVPEVADGPLKVQLAALSASVYDAYQVARFSFGDENPFAEPANLPSNVEGGYGVVGAVTLVEVTFSERGG